MILGMSAETFTLLHVLISLAGLAAGVVVLAGLMRGRRLEPWTAVFLAATVATTVTGFAFPFRGVTPALITGWLSLPILAVAILALYRFQLAGAWRRRYVIAAVAGFYFNAVAAVVEVFRRVPALKAIAPAQNEPPFLIAQLALLALFIYAGIVAVRNFKAAPGAAAYAQGAGR